MAALSSIIVKSTVGSYQIGEPDRRYHGSAGEAASVLQVFRSERPNLVRVQITEMLVACADVLAWELGLRSYDAVHLASALLWQDGMGEEITFATFDRQLWEAAGQRGLVLFPDDLPAMLAT